MPRVPDETIERLKQEVSVERLAEARGVKLARHGADLIGLCPFHDDREPSLVVSPKKNLWHCLGACQAGGTSIDWVMKTEGVSFRHAVELMRADVPVSSTSEPVKTSTVRKLPPPVERGVDDTRLLEQIAAYYHETLKQSPEALGYLAKRGLTHPEMLGRFRLGYANRTLGLRLPAKNRRAGEEMRAQMQRLGVIRESGHEHLNGSVVIPVLSLTGEVMQMYGRKINGEILRPGTPAHLYLPGPHRGVWNEEALAASKEIILCESLIDALTFWCAGFRNVTASYGVNGFTDDHREAFRKHGVRQVWIAYDRDEAGDKSSLALAEELMAMGIDCYRILFPKGMDANEYALKVTPAEKSLGLLINKAQWLGNGLTRGDRFYLPDGGDKASPVLCATPPERAKVEKVEGIPEAATKENKPEPVLSLAAEKPPAAEVNGEEIAIVLGDRRYRVRGLARNQSYELLKVNLLASHGDGFHVDTLDLYSARQRAVFIKQAALEMGLAEDAVKHDLRHVLRKLEELQDAGIRKILEPEKPEIAISEEDRAAALELLADPRLLDRIVEDFARCGVVGEETNKKVAYLAAVSRLLDAPLAVIVQSSSAAGKSSLMDAVLQLMPEEQRVEYSAMTGQSLFYMGETDLKNKILAIVEEEGAQRAAYALKLLQSEGALTIASTGKDPATGRLVTHQYRVEGPVAIFLTTTAIEVDEELLNRCLVLTVNEDREQTRAIHHAQREAQTLAGLLAKHRRQSILALHRNAQRLLRPLAVVNPHAHELSFPDHLTRARRDHMKYLALIRSVTLLHQYQRPVKTALCGDKRIEYIESTAEDIRAAGDLIQQVLGRSLGELPPQTRRLLLLVDEMVSKECSRLTMERADFRFSRREVREWTGWSDAQLKRHLHKLEELEYLIAHRGGRGQSFVYELFFVCPADLEKPFLPGLAQHYDEKKYGSNDEKNGPGTPMALGMYGGGADAPQPITAGLANGFGPLHAKNAVVGGSL
jgi:DNA primase catalytic core